MNEPKLTIGMPVYNDKAYLAKALDSILSQSYKDYILIISDDCSIDGSELVCKQFAEQDPRIKYIRQPENLGISSNMKFLLNHAETEYFMWTANDDLWDVDFVYTLITSLEENPDAVSAMSPVCFIDNEDKKIESLGERFIDYSGNSAFDRIKRLVIKFDDCFGYGVFRLKEIKSVEFPVWKWINKRCPYNNIYSTLCFYLTKGNYVLAGEKPMWFNRIKPLNEINHKTPYSHTFVRYIFALLLRKINLVVESFRMIVRAGGSVILIIRLFPYFFLFWIIKHTLYEVKERIRLLSIKEISIF